MWDFSRYSKILQTSSNKSNPLQPHRRRPDRCHSPLDSGSTIASKTASQSRGHSGAMVGPRWGHMPSYAELPMNRDSMGIVIDGLHPSCPGVSRFLHSLELLMLFVHIFGLVLHIPCFVFLGFFLFRTVSFRQLRGTYCSRHLFTVSADSSRC